MITMERAREIMTQAQSYQCGPWADHISKVITPKEDAEIKQHWDSLPGTTSYMDSFFDFLEGCVGELG